MILNYSVFKGRMNGHGYSMRKARMGSTDAARRAGSQLASIDAASRTNETAANAP
jgi:hypothetical protein